MCENEVTAQKIGAVTFLPSINVDMCENEVTAQKIGAVTLLLPL
jgi:hypothetical protein